MLPKDVWKTMLVREVETITRVTEVYKTEELMYKGELIEQHGADEALDFIRREEYRKVFDDGGDEAYVKVRKTIKAGVKWEGSAAVERSNAHYKLCLEC